MNKTLLSLLSILFITLVGMRYNVAILAWLMFVPLLLLIRDTKGFKSWLFIFGLFQLAYFLQIAKIITDPMPIVMALLFSAPIALGSFILILLYEKVRIRSSEIVGIFFFASLATISEWISFSSSPLGSWGAMTYTQLGNLPFLQISSLFGITLGSFFIYLSSAFIASFIASKEKKELFKPALASVLVYLGFYIYGVVRLEHTQASSTIQVAAIVSDMQITPKGIPDDKYLEEGTNTLLNNTQIAIDKGAKIVAWNEGATIIKKEKEKNFIERVKKLSLENSVDLVIAYIVPIDGIRKFENKYLYIQQGEIQDEYFKYHPVPGEPAIKGEKIAKVQTMNSTKISGAICYDFDFPPLARALSQQDIDIAVVPSSDWKGIDHIHGQMASVRAIEGGFSLIRPVRASTSYAFDAYGRVRASMDYFEDNSRIMMATLPTKRVETLYSQVGDIFVYFLMVFLGIVGISTLKGRKN